MTTLFARLKAETKPAHDSLERKLDLLSPDLSLSDYRRIIEKFFGFYSPVEEAMKTSRFAEAYFGRWKTEILKNDLRDLGMNVQEISELPRCLELPPFEQEEHFLGTLYVLEGSTLGGTVLAKHFGPRFHLDHLNGLRFFTVYGAKTAENWNNWRTFSEEYATSRGLDQNIIVSQADKTFTSLEFWLTRHS